MVCVLVDQKNYVFLNGAILEAQALINVTEIKKGIKKDLFFIDPNDIVEGCKEVDLYSKVLGVVIIVET